MTTWSEAVDGTRVGPSTTWEVPEGTIRLTAVWDDVNGVGISVDVPADTVLDKERAARLARAIVRLVGTKDPMTPVQASDVSPAP
jgi:hypothetical protein